MDINYIIITAVKNEELYIHKTINSILNQTILPKQWIIVDDFSTDSTFSIINELIKDYKWIQLKTNMDIKENDVSTRVSKTINKIIQIIEIDNFDVICKIDGDINFDQYFIANIINEFKNNNNLGIASGSAVFNGKKESSDEFSLTRGATKFYRTDCFKNIGGIYEGRGWDSIDNYMALKNGWHIKKCEYSFTHLKKEGVKTSNLLLHYQTGLYSGRIPYYFPFFLFKILIQSIKSPFIIGSLLQLIGYVNTRWIKMEKPFSNDLSRYVKKIQIDRLKKALF